MRFSRDLNSIDILCVAFTFKWCGVVWCGVCVCVMLSIALYRAAVKSMALFVFVWIICTGVANGAGDGVGNVHRFKFSYGISSSSFRNMKF